MLSIRAALDLMMPRFATLGMERVPLTAALGRVLARDVLARRDLPELDNSAMDGYALRSADATQSGVALAVVDEARAGGALPGALAAGHATRIFTGAPLPAGADCIVMQENTTRTTAGEVVILEPATRGQHVRARGSDLRHGEVALAKHAPLGPGELGLLAALDEAQLDVFRRPRVAVLCTGDELRDVGEPERPGSIVSSNAYALAAAITQAGAEAIVLPTARDRLDEITARVRQGLGADLLLSVGGVSVGDYDFVERALRDAGVVLAFHKVAVKPGKPILFGTHGEVPVVGLPGNPVSALVTFEVFVRPGLMRMLGHLTPFSVPVRVELASVYAHALGRTELARARLESRGERLIAQLHARQGSGSLPSMAGCDALVILPHDRERFEAGSHVWALRLGDAPRSATPPFED